MQYRIITFGCQMNKSDSERIATVLEKIGYKPAPAINGADLIVVNMCSVRQSAVDRVYGLVSKFQKIKNKKSGLKTILTGCLLRKDKKKLANRFDLVLDIANLPKWPKILDVNSAVISGRELLNTEDYLKIQPKYSSNFSALVPIMTGCNNFCTYCVVPYTRGREISRPAEEIICEIKKLIKRGHKEIWLLGQNVNSYKGRFNPVAKKRDRLNKRQDIKFINFPQLLRKINDVPGNFWIRFTSSHPKDFSDELINAMANCEKVTEYLNLPAQSGDNEILKKMNRSYTVAQYKNLVKKIRKKIPNISLSTDIIVGFPGETKKQFENTVNLFKEIKFDMAYIAKYSPRPGTAAAKMEDTVPQKEKDRREKVLTEILKENTLENNKKYIGKEIEILVENQKSPNSWLGKTRTHKNVLFESKKNLLGKFIRVKITDAHPWGLKGKIL